MPLYKVCEKCGKAKPPSGYFRTKGGTTSTCIECFDNDILLQTCVQQAHHVCEEEECAVKKSVYHRKCNTCGSCKTMDEYPPEIDGRHSAKCSKCVSADIEKKPKHVKQIIPNAAVKRRLELKEIREKFLTQNTVTTNNSEQRDTLVVKSEVMSAPNEKTTYRKPISVMPRRSGGGGSRRPIVPLQDRADARKRPWAEDSHKKHKKQHPRRQARTPIFDIVTEKKISEIKNDIGAALPGVHAADIYSIIDRADRLVVDSLVIVNIWKRCGGHCEICGRDIFLSECSRGDKFGDVARCDHDHVDGRVRGMLCAKCNLLVVPGYELAIRYGEDKVRAYLGMNDSGKLPAGRVLFVGDGAVGMSSMKFPVSPDLIGNMCYIEENAEENMNFNDGVSREVRCDQVDKSNLIKKVM